MSTLLPLVVFSFVTSVTPGPNNLLLWASGVQFGFARCLAHVVGTGVGVVVMAVGVAAGLGVVVTTVPGVAIALKVAGSAYLLYLAVRIAGGTVTAGAETSRPLTLWQAMAFQAVNAKAWVFVLAAMSTFRPTALPVIPGSALTATIMGAVALATAAIWAAGGSVVSRLVSSPRTQRAVSVALAGLLIASIAYLWV